MYKQAGTPSDQRRSSRNFWLSKLPPEVSDVKVLSISDKVIPFIYSPQVKKIFHDVEFVIACGDLPYYYQEYLISVLNIPLYFVRGNHDPLIEYRESCESYYPLGGIDLHRRVIFSQGLLLAGVEGSVRYNNREAFQYTQREMWHHVFRLVPSMLMNRLLRGRFLDVFVSHAPPWGIHDESDFVHQGIKAFRWLLSTFKPRYHFHGHIHIYHPDTVTATRFGETAVINTYGYQTTNLDFSADERNKEWSAADQNGDPGLA